MTASHPIDRIKVQPRDDTVDIESQLNDLGKQLAKMLYNTKHQLKGKTVVIGMPGCPELKDIKCKKYNRQVEKCQCREHINYNQKMKQIVSLRELIINIAHHATKHGIFIEVEHI